MNPLSLYLPCPFQFSEWFSLPVYVFRTATGMERELNPFTVAVTAIWMNSGWFLMIVRLIQTAFYFFGTVKCIIQYVIYIEICSVI